MKNKNKKKIQQTNLMFQVFLWSELSPKHSLFMREFNKDNANLEKVFFLDSTIVKLVRNTAEV